MATLLHNQKAKKEIIMRDSVVFYRSFYDAVKDLDAESFKQCITALMEYSLNEKEVDVDGFANMFMMMAKPLIDKNNKRYENGRKGGRPKKHTDEEIQDAKKARNSVEYIKWRDLVIERDGCCKLCGSKENLHAHHIKDFISYPELRYDVENGVTLCGSCHAKVHSEEPSDNQNKPSNNQKKPIDNQNKPIAENGKPNVYVNVNDNIYIQAKLVIDYLNQRTGKAFRYVDSNLKYISGRLKEGFTYEDCKKVIDVKVKEWMNNDMAKYLTPETLFRPSNFEKYINQKESGKVLPKYMEQKVESKPLTVEEKVEFERMLGELDGAMDN